MPLPVPTLKIGAGVAAVLLGIEVLTGIGDLPVTNQIGPEAVEHLRNQYNYLREHRIMSYVGVVGSIVSGVYLLFSGLTDLDRKPEQK